MVTYMHTHHFGDEDGLFGLWVWVGLVTVVRLRCLGFGFFLLGFLLLGLLCLEYGCLKSAGLIIRHRLV